MIHPRRSTLLLIALALLLSTVPVTRAHDVVGAIGAPTTDGGQPERNPRR